MLTVLQRCGEHIATIADEGNKKTQRVLRGIDKGGDLADAVGQGVERIASVVEGLERFTQLDASDRELVDVRENLDTAIAVLGHPIERSYASEVLQVSCYPARLNQVFLAILENAVTAIDHTQSVRASVVVVDDCVVVEIADDGVGIATNDLNGIFQVGFSKKEGRMGMRLGLPIAKQQVEEIGGTITIDSTEGQGTTVGVALPG